MNDLVRNTVLTLAVLSILIVSCVPGNDPSEISERDPSEAKRSTMDLDEEQIKNTVERLLIAAGNYDIESLDDMISDRAMLGISSFEGGVWSNSEIAIDEYFTSANKRAPRPYCEIPMKYSITVTEGRLALVKADCILYRYGIPQTKEINHFTLMKEGENWDVLNISWTKKRISQEEMVYDLDLFAHGYAQAWCSKRPGFVSSFFSEDGVLQVNDGEPAQGRSAIYGIAEGFMTDLPDMRVVYDSIVPVSAGTQFHWTLIATNSAFQATQRCHHRKYRLRPR